MTHSCKQCGKSEPEVRFAKQDGSKKLRSMCNGCRTASDKRTAQPEQEPKTYGSSWAALCADCRPNWGWNNRHIPKNHDKGQEFQI